MVARLASFWQDLVQSVRAAPSVVVLVSHGGALSTLMNRVVLPSGGAALARGIEPSRFWNCSISEIEFYEDAARTPTVVRWADVSHLAETTHRVVNVDEPAN